MSHFCILAPWMRLLKKESVVLYATLKVEGPRKTYLHEYGYSSPRYMRETTMLSLCNVCEFPRFSTYKISITPLWNMFDVELGPASLQIYDYF